MPWSVASTQLRQKLQPQPRKVHGFLKGSPLHKLCGQFQCTSTPDFRHCRDRQTSATAPGGGS